MEEKTMKILFPLIILFFNIAVFGQVKNSTACSLAFTELPEIRGLKLGMTSEQVAGLYPELQLFAPESKFSGIALEGKLLKESITDIEYQNNLQFIYFVFFDKSLAAISVRYDDSIYWDSPKEFTAQVTKSINIPLSSWRADKQTDGSVKGYNLQCKDFSIRSILSQSKYPTLMIKRNTEDVFVENEKRKKMFKP
jgi:hypothetical protein